MPTTFPLASRGCHDQPLHRYRMRSWVVVLLLGLSLFGCSRSDTPQQTGQKSGTDSDKPAATVWDSQVNTLKQAETLRDKLNADTTARKAQRDAIQDGTQP